MNRLMVLCGIPALEEGMKQALAVLLAPKACQNIVCTKEEDWKTSAKQADLIVLCSFMENDPAAADAFAWCRTLKKPVLYAEGAGLPVLMRLAFLRNEVDTPAELKECMEGGRPYGLIFSLFENL